MSANEKTFSLFTKTSKTFRLILTSFEYAITLITRIFMRIPITFITSAIFKVSQIMKLKRIRIVISQIKLRINQSQIFNLKRIRLVISVMERVKEMVDIIQRLNISFVSKVRQKISSTIILKKFLFSFIPTVATFYSLGYYDPLTLAAMDIKTLGDLDYIIA